MKKGDRDGECKKNGGRDETSSRKGDSDCGSRGKATVSTATVTIMASTWGTRRMTMT